MSLKNITADTHIQNHLIEVQKLMVLEVRIVVTLAEGSVTGGRMKILGDGNVLDLDLDGGYIVYMQVRT